VTQRVIWIEARRAPALIISIR
jgi:hypothetical protein